MKPRFEIRLIAPDIDRDICEQALRMLALEFVSAPEKREGWVATMSSNLSNGYDDVAAGVAQRGGAMFVGMLDQNIVSVFTLKFYAKDLIFGQQYFVVDPANERIGVTTFGNIATAMCGNIDGNVISEYDLSFVKRAFRGMDFHQQTSKAGYEYALSKHQGEGVSFALIRSNVAGEGYKLGRQLRDHIINTVGMIPFEDYRSQAFSLKNSISISDMVELIGDQSVLGIHKSSGAAAHVARKQGGAIVGYLISNFSTLFMTCHR